MITNFNDALQKNQYSIQSKKYREAQLIRPPWGPSKSGLDIELVLTVKHFYIETK